MACRVGEGQSSTSTGPAAYQRSPGQGVEFDHVVVLDGNWSNAGREEEVDAPRRLYYVAMTRARLTLTLAKSGNSNPFPAGAGRSPLSLGQASIGTRTQCTRGSEALLLPAQPSRCAAGVCGFRSPGHRIHKAIASLSPGDYLKVMTERSPWELTNSEGIAVGRLAQSFRVPQNSEDVSATVLAIARWSKSKSELEFLDRLRTDEWEVVIPEIVIVGNS